MLQNLKSKLKKIEFVRDSYKVLFLKGEKFFARRDLYKVKSKEGKINNSNKEFNESGDSVREVEAYVDPKLNCVLGWVPYLNDKTSDINRAMNAIKRAKNRIAISKKAN